MSIYDRTKLILGDKIDKIKSSNVIVCGVGGVGGYVVESLVRTGLGDLTIVDNDTIDETNINRQIIALNRTIGKYKVEVLKDRCLNINKDLNITCIKDKLTVNNISEIITNCDYVVDAIDDIEAKIALIEYCKNNNINIISCMGMGNRLNPLDIRIDKIKNTSVCPLAKKIRKILRYKQITDLKVVYSIENPIKQKEIGSVPFVPSVAGMVITSEIVKDLI